MLSVVGGYHGRHQRPRRARATVHEVVTKQACTLKRLKHKLLQRSGPLRCHADKLHVLVLDVVNVNCVRTRQMHQLTVLVTSLVKLSTDLLAVAHNAFDTCAITFSMSFSFLPIIFNPLTCTQSHVHVARHSVLTALLARLRDECECGVRRRIGAECDSSGRETQQRNKLQ
jgi:hypothetical protein